MCNHDWQPIPGWYARYRCALCHVIGCKFGLVVARYQERSMAIEPYRCESRCGGVKCNQPAVHGWRGKAFRCAGHRRDARTKTARAQLAAARQGGTTGVREEATTPVASMVDSATPAADLA